MRFAPRSNGNPSVVGVAGDGASLIDFDNAVYGNFPLMLTLIAIGTFLLLARAFRSVVLALKAVVFNLVSLAAAYGALTFIWQQGHGSDALWGIPASGAITMWVPLMVFAFLFGLSMDYEVFIISRIREAYDKTGSARVGGRRGHRSHRTAGHQRGADPHAHVPLDVERPGDRHQDPRHRARCGHPRRRGHRASADGAGDGGAVRPLELVDAGVAGAGAARRAVPGRAARGSSSPRVGAGCIRTQMGAVLETARPLHVIGVAIIVGT